MNWVSEIQLLSVVSMHKMGRRVRISGSLAKKAAHTPSVGPEQLSAVAKINSN